MSHGLAPETTLAFVSVGLVDGMEVSAQADLACAHLCDDRADRSVCANMCGERPFSWPYTEFEELSAVFSRFPDRSGGIRPNWSSTATSMASSPVKALLEVARLRVLGFLRKDSSFLH